MAQDTQYPAPSRSSRRQAGLPPINHYNQQNNQVPFINTGASIVSSEPAFLPDRACFRDPMVETASASQFSFAQDNASSHMSGPFIQPNPTYIPQPYQYNTYANAHRGTFSGPSSTTPSFSSASTLPVGSHMGTISSQTDSSFLRSQIHHLTEDKRSLESRLNQVISQLEQTNRNNMQREQHFTTLMNQLRKKEDENGRLLQMVLLKQNSTNKKAAPSQNDLIDFISINAFNKTHKQLYSHFYNHVQKYPTHHPPRKPRFLHMYILCITLGSFQLRVYNSWWYGTEKV